MGDKMLKFYHISREASDERLKKFLEQGIEASGGVGYGGQTCGFYCWTSETRADKYYASLLVAADADWAMENFGIDIRLKNGEALKIGVPVALDAITYPRWQLDNEQHPAPKRGRERSLFLDFWEAQKGEFQQMTQFEFENNLNEKCVVHQFGWNENERCPVLYYTNALHEDKQEIVNSTNANHSSRTQAINDYLCEHSPQYCENYNQLIQAVAQNLYQTEINGIPLYTSDIALKYCGTEPITQVEVAKVSGKVAYDAESGQRLLPESDDEMAWGEYRIVKHEQKFSSNGVNVTKEVADVYLKIGGKKISDENETKSASLNKDAVLKLKMAQSKCQKS